MAHPDRRPKTPRELRQLANETIVVVAARTGNSPPSVSLYERFGPGAVTNTNKRRALERYYEQLARRLASSKNEDAA